MTSKLIAVPRSTRRHVETQKSSGCRSLVTARWYECNACWQIATKLWTGTAAVANRVTDYHYYCEYEMLGINKKEIGTPWLKLSPLSARCQYSRAVQTEERNLLIYQRINNGKENNFHISFVVNVCSGSNGTTWINHVREDNIKFGHRGYQNVNWLYISQNLDQQKHASSILNFIVASCLTWHFFAACFGC
jgi:hypothetical protein